MTGKLSPWVKGQSGNPKGRPRGVSQVAKWRNAIANDVNEILGALVMQAKAGDPMAAKLILERVLPALKPSELAISIVMPDGLSLTDQGRAVMGAVADGALAPGQGSQLLAGIAQLARVAEIDELSARITALENPHGDT